MRIYEFLLACAPVLIVEQRAEERDPEDRDGNLPDLEHPRQ